MQHRVFIVGLALACLAFLNCSKDFTTSTLDSGPGAEQGVRGDSTMEPGERTSAINCGGGELCDPTTHRCVQDLSCSGHADCGQAAYCDGGAFIRPIGLSPRHHPPGRLGLRHRRQAAHFLWPGLRRAALWRSDRPGHRLWLPDCDQVSKWVRSAG